MKLTQLRKNNSGFTLIEVLLVVAIIALLAGIVILAINPNRQLGQGKDAQRAADVTTILNAVYQYSIDNDGDISGLGLSTTATPICADAGCGTSSNIDLGALTLDEEYLVAIPEDPTTATTESAGYTILRSATGRITVAAPGAEESTITVTR